MLRDQRVLALSPCLAWAEPARSLIAQHEDRAMLVRECERFAGRSGTQVAALPSGGIRSPVSYAILLGGGGAARRHLSLWAAIIISILLGFASPGCSDRGPGLALDGTGGRPRVAPADALDSEPTVHYQGEMAGEVTLDSVILQARLTRSGRVGLGDVQGRLGVGAFAVATDSGFTDAEITGLAAASAENDYQVKVRVGGLRAGTQYYYRLLSGEDEGALNVGPIGTFKTLGGTTDPVSFVAVTGMNRFAFVATTWGRDRALGFPALATIVEHTPDYFISTGDSVYYDTPYFVRADTLGEMRAKWHRQFATPRFRDLFLATPTYWLKDDHDFRYDDSDPYGPLAPSPSLAQHVFREQVPIVDPAEEGADTYRTHRLNSLVQIWLLEGRDHRDRNTLPPGLA